MYYIKGVKEILQTIKIITNFNNNLINWHDRDLKIAYHKFLVEESVLTNLDFSNQMMLVDIEGIKEISPPFYKEKKDFFIKNSPILNDRITGNFFDQALEKLKVKSEDIYDVCNFLIKVVLINQLQSYTNGTTDETIGLSTIDFKDHFGEDDFIELIIHQMTHMALFLDDRCYLHMEEKNKNFLIETGMRFVLGGTMFPAYIAFHSYIVGVEILQFRRQVMNLHFKGNYHGDTARIIKVCLAFKRSLMDHSSLFALRGISLLSDASNMLDQIILDYKEL